MSSKSSETAPNWSLVTNHGHVLACIAADPDARLRDIAVSVGITERTAFEIVVELERAGYLTRTRIGRRNRYEVPAVTIAQLLGLLLQTVDQQPFT